MRRILIINDGLVQAPLPAAAEAAMRKWCEANLETMRAALAPFGLKPEQIVEPEWRMYVDMDMLPK